MQSTFFRGTSHDQDARFADKNRQFLTKLKFPPNFSIKVDMKKVALEPIKPWVSHRITELLGVEDDVVVNLCFNMLSGSAQESIDPRELQINLTGFMGQNAKVFVSELWNLLISAQNSQGGVPADLLERYAADQPVSAFPQVDLLPVPPPGRYRSTSADKNRDYSFRTNHVQGRRQRRSRSPASWHRKSSAHRRAPGRNSRRSRSWSFERGRHRDERRRRHRHRRRHSASPSSSSPSIEQPLFRADHHEILKTSAVKILDPRAAEDELRMLALRSIVMNKNKQQKNSNKSDAS